MGISQMLAIKATSLAYQYFQDGRVKSTRPKSLLHFQSEKRKINFNYIYSDHLTDLFV